MTTFPQYPTAFFPNDEPFPFAQYDRFASIYDGHFGNYAQRFLPALERLLLGTLPRNSRILDVCCGTGQLAAALTEQGFVVTGVDGSPEMLRIAQRHTPQAQFILDDVRTFYQPERFDAAVSTFDSINHILEPAELQATFANVYQALCPGGRFVFDMNMEDGYRRRWGGTFRGADEGREFSIQANYCPETKLGRNVVTWLSADANRPTQITFVERCYPERAVCDALTAAGFYDIEVYDGHRDLELFGEVGRSFFVCRKSFWERVRPEPEPCGPACRQRWRGISTCVKDALWPAEPVQLELGVESRRLQALEEVLSTLPPEPYRQLQGEAARFDWFIPGDRVLGQVHPFRAGVGAERWARVVYLSPLLEQQEWPVVVTVVVHELAHVILGHRLLDLDRVTYDRQEEAVRQAVREWGFQVEAERTDEHLWQQVFNRLVPESILTPA